MRGTVAIGWFLAFALALTAKASPAAPAEPVPAPVPEPVPESTPTDSESAAAQLRSRADRIRALRAGTLDLDTDPADLFTLDLTEPHLADRFADLVEALQRARSSEAPTAPPEPASDLDAATLDWVSAYVSFATLPELERQAALAAHDGRRAQQRARSEAEQRAEAQRVARTEQASRLEALLSGTLDPDIDPGPLLRVDLGVEHWGTAADAAELGELDAAARAAQARLVAAYRRFVELEPAARDALLANHAQRRDADATEAEIEIVDEEENRTRDAINDAREAADEAQQQQQQALEAARKAQTETLRAIATEQARLLQVKHGQAVFAGSLPKREQEAKKAREAALEWNRRVSELANSYAPAEELSARADPMYLEIRDDLALARDALRQALQRLSDPATEVPTPGRDPSTDAPSTDALTTDELARLRLTLEADADALIRRAVDIGWEVAESLRDDIVLLNRNRLILLGRASPRLRERVSGLTPDGADQAARELDQITLELAYHARSLPRDLQRYVTQRRSDPLSVAVEVVELMLAIAIFRWWRRRADDILRRGELPRYARRDAAFLRRGLGHVVWYLRRIRGPLEWLALVFVLMKIVGESQEAPETRLIWIVAAWTLTGAAATLLLDAIVVRETLHPWARAQASNLRLGSLRVLGITVVGVGLLLDLTAEMVGQGAIYNWVWSTCWVLIAPIALWLVLRWRPTIFERVSKRAGTNAILKWVAGEHRWLGSFSAAAVGGVYLIGVGVGRFVVRQLSGLDATRKLLAYLFRREVAKQAEGKPAAHEHALPADALAALDPEAPAQPLLASVGADEVRDVVELTQVETTTLTAVVGERGLGKTTFLHRVTGRSEDVTCLVSCPPDGFDALLEVLAEHFEAPEPTPNALATAIRGKGPTIVCVDDAHRMIEPAIGGLGDLDRFTRFALHVGGDVSWVVTLEDAAWHYVRRARGDRVFFDQIIELAPWTEEQIATLIRGRTREAELTPRFSELVVPRQLEAPVPAGQRSEVGYYRILWDHAAGNPAVAIHAWRRSLFVRDDDKRPIVRLFELPSATDIEGLPLPLLFVLRAIVQLDLASEPEIVQSTQLPAADVADAIRYSLTRGYVERRRDRVRLTWTWYRTITTVLARQHLLVA